jgi:uncharacterized protein YbjT (DUF2867 family)
MILVTGSAGKTGRAILQALLAKGKSVRALVHRPDHIPPMRALGVQEVVIGEMRNVQDMQRACDRIRGVYHICPNVSPDEITIGQTIMAAAQSAGVEHFVFHSVLHPQTEAMPHHWKKLRVEEQLIQSGLAYTILQPAVYLQNILTHWESISEQGVYPVPYPEETCLSFVDVRDVAQAAAIVMSEPGHQNATYELVGTPGISQNEIAAILSKYLHKPVRIRVISLSDWEQQARASGLGEYQIDALTRMFRYYAQYGLCGNPMTLNWLLNKSPITLEIFIEQASQQQVQAVHSGK